MAHAHKDFFKKICTMKGVQMHMEITLTDFMKIVIWGKSGILSQKLQCVFKASDVLERFFKILHNERSQEAYEIYVSDF